MPPRPASCALPARLTSKPCHTEQGHGRPGSNRIQPSSRPPSAQKSKAGLVCLNDAGGVPIMASAERAGEQPPRQDLAGPSSPATCGKFPAIVGQRCVNERWATFYPRLLDPDADRAAGRAGQGSPVGICPVGAGGSGLGEDRPAMGTGNRHARRPGQVFAESDRQGGRGTLGGGAGDASRRGGRTGIGAGGTLRRERGPIGPGGAGHDSPAAALEPGPAVSSRGASSGPVPGIAGRPGGSRGSAGSVGPATGLASGPVVRREPSAEPGGTGRPARGLVPGGSGQAAAVPDLHGAAAEPVLHGAGGGVGMAAHPAADGGPGGAESDASDQRSGRRGQDADGVGVRASVSGRLRRGVLDQRGQRTGAAHGVRADRGAVGAAARCGGRGGGDAGGPALAGEQPGSALAVGV